MTKLPSESFWPLSPHDIDARYQFPKLTSDSSSVISPLTLPRGVAGYFDKIAVKGGGPSPPVFAIQSASDGPLAHSSRGSRVYSPLSPAVRGPTLQHPSFLPPHLLPTTREGQYQLEQYRSSSLPPKARNGLASRTAVGLPLAGLRSFANAPMSPTGLASAGHPRSISADAASAPSHAHMIRRLVRQNARIREAWEAERKYLEANRERVEEVYTEERVFMEEERAEWDAERAVLLQKIEHLQQQVSALGAGAQSATNGTQASSNSSFSGLGLRGGDVAPSRESPRSSQSSQGTTQSTTQSGRPIARNGDLSRSSTRIKRPDPALLATARTPNGPSIPTCDFLKPDSASESETEPVPIVDVQEIHPELEGIPIKATTVQKPTFAHTPPSHAASQASSRSGSPPTNAARPKSPRGSKHQTMQVLAAKEADRLTMHAGHTPSHSLSSLATNASSGTATATSNGGHSTPTQQPDVANDICPEVPHNTEQASHQGHPLDDHPEAIFEPGEDCELRGPLMVRNMPAHDEIFFQKLSDKLEEVSKDDEAALPAVLKDSERAEQPEQQSRRQSDAQQAAVGADASGPKNDTGSPTGGDDDKPEPAIPLKLKTRMNFGAPFGAIR
ncbi:hypothetical protein BT67DRAFT_442868 [Trichocladium antarcticum]|uniref:Uncharacterized protein n=1 Tax=Trichocladium antarcticum TaxID=1450529 RepID=A0AAN6UIM9_9PEZI|nr:hypothetical protein BT67DRAFT_442868 [Trichocladium antarcticum]